MTTDELKAEVAHLEARRGALLAEVDALRAAVAQRDAVIERAQAEVSTAQSECERLRAALAALPHSDRCACCHGAARGCVPGDPPDDCEVTDGACDE